MSTEVTTLEVPLPKKNNERYHFIIRAVAKYDITASSRGNH
jgi:hypothetical protein